MKTHSAVCKLCHQTILVEIDDNYDIEHDPYKLLAMLVCNACCARIRHLRKIHSQPEREPQAQASLPYADD